jgi:hypothetical protein
MAENANEDLPNVAVRNGEHVACAKFREMENCLLLSTSTFRIKYWNKVCSSKPANNHKDNTGCNRKTNKSFEQQLTRIFRRHFFSGSQQTTPGGRHTL